jgi:hypothetical protein
VLHDLARFQPARHHLSHLFAGIGLAAPLPQKERYQFPRALRLRAPGGLSRISGLGPADDGAPDPRARRVCMSGVRPPEEGGREQPGAKEANDSIVCL